RTAFASESMTEEWRARTLHALHHVPELDLVAEATDGTLAGYCLGWWDATHRQGQVEPLAVAPAYWGRGIGRALLGALLHRFEALGADRVLVETDTTRPAALRTYASAGFVPRFRSVRRGRGAERPGAGRG